MIRGFFLGVISTCYARLEQIAQARAKSAPQPDAAVAVADVLALGRTQNDRTATARHQGYGQTTTTGGLILPATLIERDRDVVVHRSKSFM